MSDRVVQPVDDANTRSRQALQRFQSVWLAHWTRKSSDAAGETCDPDDSRNKELGDATTTRNDCLTKDLEDSSMSVRGLGMIKIRTFEIGDDIIQMSSKSRGNKRMLGSLFKDGQETDDVQALRPEFSRDLERGKAVDCKSGIQFPSLIPGIPAANGIPSTVGEGASSNPPKWMRTRLYKKDSIFLSIPLLERSVESSSRIVPHRFEIGKYEFDKGKAAVSVVARQSESADVRTVEHELCHEHGQLTDLVCERKVDCPSRSDNSLHECFRENIRSDHYLSTFGRGRFPEMHKCSGIRMFPSQSNSSEESETKGSRNDSYSLLKLQNCVHDVETMRICTTVDSLEGTRDGCPRFSQTMNGLLITKKTDVNTFKGNDMFRSTRVITKIGGNISSELHSVSPFSGQGKPQVKKLPPPSNLIDGEVKENIRDIKASKFNIENGSSAETNTMDMDSFTEKNSKKNLHPGSNFMASTKAFIMESDAPPWSHISSRGVGHRQLNNKLPHINLELAALPGAASSSENMRPSSSTTWSLEMEKLLEHAGQPQPKSNSSLDDLRNADPGNRWVKRLKLSSSNSSAQGAKSSNIASGSSHEKMSKLFSRILENSTTGSAPTLGEQHGKKPVLSEKNGEVSEKDDNRMMENPKDKGKALLLSHAWIRRWLHDRQRRTEKKHERDDVHEPQSSKPTQEKVQREQFPSIAAMALMGKALTCFQPCELQKMGSLTVWNTKTLS